MRCSNLRLLAGLVLAMSFLSSCKSPSDSGPPNVPLAPTNVSAVNTTSQDTISWSAASEATSYNVYRSTTSGVTKANGTKFAGAMSPFTQTGLTNGMSYYYVVTAVNAAGESQESSQVSATPIAAPTGATVTCDQRMAETYPESNLIWTGVPGATSYNVYHSSSPAVTPLNGTKVSNAGSDAWRLGDGPAPTSDYFIVTAVNSKGESAPSSPAARGLVPLNPNRYLSAPLITHAQQTSATASDFGLSIPNLFAENAPIVFIGPTAPTHMSIGTAYYAKGSGSNSLGCYNLADSSHNELAASSDVGNCTIYGLDWTLIKLGTVTPVAGIFTVPGHNLIVGDTVYIAASPASTKLKTGAYLVSYVPDANSFALDSANFAVGDSINYLAKVNSTAGAVTY